MYYPLAVTGFGFLSKLVISMPNFAICHMTPVTNPVSLTININYLNYLIYSP